MRYRINPFTKKLDDIGDESGYVPYTGATSNVNLGAHSLQATKIGIGISPSSYSLDVNGKIAINGEQTIYNAGAINSNFIGTLYLGNGGGSLASGAYYNIAIGKEALYSNTSGTANTAIGVSALYTNTTGGQNFALGFHSLYDNSTGEQNLGIGTYSLVANTTGNYNVALGNVALFYNTTGSGNVSLGYDSGSFNKDWGTMTNNNYCVYIGYDSKGSASGNTNEIAIGFNVDGNGSNSVTLGNDSITKTILKGNVGLGTNSPTQKLEIYQSSGTPTILGRTNGVNGDEFRIDSILTGSSLTTSRIASIRTATGALTDIYFSTFNGSSLNERMRVTSSGNVGIGTTNPSSKLDVIGDGSFSTNLTIGSNLTLSSLTASKVVFTDASKNLTSTGIGTSSQFIKGDGSLDSSSYAPLASPTFTGTVTLPEVQLGETGIKLDDTLSADEKWSGITIGGTLGATIAVGDLCYLNNDDGRWELVDANLSDGYDKQLGICLTAGNDGSSTTMLVFGKVRSAAFPAFTIGSPLYISETAGDITHTQPTTADVAIRVVGFALTAEDLMFNPSNDYIVHT